MWKMVIKSTIPDRLYKIELIVFLALLRGIRVLAGHRGLEGETGLEGLDMHGVAAADVSPFIYWS